MNVQLEPALEQFVAELIASGRFASQGEVIREGLLLLKERQASDAQLEELRRQVQAGLDDIERGNVADLDMEEIRSQARAEWEATRGRSA